MEQTYILIHRASDSYIGRTIILSAMYLLDAGMWFHEFAGSMKVLYTIIAGVVTILGLINQWNTFYKTYKTIWIVVKIEWCITQILPKKKIRIRKGAPKRKAQ